jgi:hypothetical protein
MAIENAHRSSVSLKLNAGSKEGTGTMIVKSCSLGNVIRGADKNKIMSVVGALNPILVHPLFRVERTEVTILEN